MTKFGTIRILRRNDWFGRFRDMDVFVNGSRSGVVKAVSHKDFQVPIGEARVYVKMGWCRSEELVFMFNGDSDFVPLEVQCPSGWMTPYTELVSAIFGSDKFFRLVVVGGVNFQR